MGQNAPEYSNNLEVSLMEELHKARADLLNAVQNLQADVLRKQNVHGWSILHVLEHLHLSEVAVVRGIKSVLNSSNVEEIPRKSLNPVSDGQKKFPSPKIAEPEGLFENLEIAIIKLNCSREELETLITSIKSTVNFKTCGFNHPYFGMLSVEQWLEVIPLHERRHISQIEEMIFS